MKTKLTIALAASLACVLLAGCGKQTNEKAMGEVPDFEEVDGEKAVVVDSVSTNVDSVSSNANGNSETGEPDFLQELTEAETKATDSVQTFDLIPKKLDVKGKQNYDDSYETSSLDYDPTKYVTLSDFYDDLTFATPRSYVVTDELVRRKMNETFDDYTLGTYEDSKAIVEEGRVVDLELTFKPEGETPFKFSVRTKIGDHEIPSVLEEKLDGLKKGDVSEPVVVEYSEDAAREILRGKTTEIVATVLGVRSFYDRSNESIAKMTDQKYQSLADYENHVRTELEYQQDNEVWATLANDVMNVLEEHAEIKGYPEAQLGRLKEKYRKQYARELEKGLTTEEEVDKCAEDEMAMHEILLAVAKQEDLEVTQEDCVAAAEYRRRVAEIESDQMWDAYLATYGKDSVVMDALYIKVMNALLEKADLTSPIAN